MISLCMMVKSNSEKLQQLIQVLYDYVGEIILLYTRETDIEYSFDNKIKTYYYPLKRDFSEVRNFAIQKADCPWIFVIDDDESINPEDLPKLQGLIQHNNVAGYRFVRYDYIGNVGWDIKLPCRLFQNSDTIRYEGSLYEEVIPSILQQNLKVETLWYNFPLHHHIDRFSYQELQEKYQFYREILTEQINKNPEDIYQRQIYLWHIAMLWADSNDFNQALYLIQKSTQTSSSFHILIQFDMVGILFAIGQIDKALQLLKNIRLSHINGVTQKYFYFKILNRLGLIYSTLEKYEEAIGSYREAINTGISSAAVYANMGIAQYMKGDEINSQKSFATALEINPYIKKMKPHENNRIWRHRLHTDIRLKSEYFKKDFLCPQ